MAVASDAARLRLLLDSPYGLLFVCLFAAETIFGGAILAATSGPERIQGLGIFAVLILVTVFVFWRMSEAARPAKTVVPGNLTQEAIPAPAAADDKLINHTDGTFAFAQPPANWQRSISTLADMTSTALQQQRIDLDASDATDGTPFKAGPTLLLKEQHNHRIGILPGRSTANGRLVLAVLDEQIAAQVIIYSVSKAGTMMRDVTAEHLFTLLLAEKANLAYRVVEIQEQKVGPENRTVLRGTAEFVYGEVTIDGGPPQQATARVTLQVIERGEFMYVITSLMLTGVPDETERRAEMEAIIASVAPRRAADAEDRGRRERDSAEAEWTRLASEILPFFLFKKAEGIVAELRGGGPQDFARAAAQFDTLAAYGKQFPQMVNPALAAQLNQWRDAVRLAEGGNHEQLNTLLAAIPHDPPVQASAEPREGRIF